jgi:hypothetical protein
MMQCSRVFSCKCGCCRGAVSASAGKIALLDNTLQTRPEEYELPVQVVLKCWTEATVTPVVLVLPAAFREFQHTVYKHRGNTHSKLYWFQTADFCVNARISVNDEASYLQYRRVCRRASVLDAHVLIVWAFTVSTGNSVAERESCW